MLDFLIDNTNELKIVNGDFAVGFCDQQNQGILLMAEKGAFKENPDVGVGLFSFLENEDQAAMYSEIRRQFTADGMTINKMSTQGAGKINIDASY